MYSDQGNTKSRVRLPIKDRLAQYALLMRLHRPIGALLLLWPTLWALWIAGKGHPSPGIVTLFVAGVILMRSAGCVINDYADRHFDPHVERTRERPLAAGRVSAREALWLFVGLCVVAFALVLLLNSLTVLLSIPAVLLAASYPFTKRHTHLPQFYLGAAFGWAAPMAFAAQLGELPLVAWLLFLATVLWAVAYDTMYAMVDREDDLKIGVKSTAILFGRWDRLMIGIFQALMLGVLIISGWVSPLGNYYYTGIAGAAIFAAYQQFLIRERSRSGCFQAFLNNNWLGLIVFLGILADYSLG